MQSKRYEIHLADWTPKQQDKFWKRVDRRGPNECWPWMAGTRKSEGFEYGCVHHGGLFLSAHRVAYLLANGSIDPDLTIDHSWAKGCRSKLCCNPAHLEQITQAENTRRQFTNPDRLYSLTHPCGHPREFAPFGKQQACRPCLVKRVAASQAKKADYYREMKTRNKREQRRRAGVMARPGRQASPIPPVSGPVCTCGHRQALHVMRLGGWCGLSKCDCRKYAGAKSL